MDFGHIAVVTLLPGPPPGMFFESWTQLMVAGLRAGDRVLRSPWRRSAHQADNDAVEEFLKTECDTLCFIECDHTFTPDTLERLRSNSKLWEYDGVGALYMIRDVPIEPPKPLLLIEKPESKGIMPEDGECMYSFVTEWTENSIVEVDCPGLGFTMLRRSVFEALENPWFFVTRQNIKACQLPYFFRHAKAKGFRFAVDTSVQVGHWVDNLVLGFPPKEITNTSERSEALCKSAQ